MELDGCYTQSDREMLDQYFRQIAWIMARRGKLAMRKGWSAEADMPDGSRVKYTFDISGYIKAAPPKSPSTVGDKS